MGAIFWAGKKAGESRSQSPFSNQNLEQKIADTQNQLAESKKQLAKETNSHQKAKLEAKIKQLEQEITNLKKQQNPPTPVPMPNGNQINTVCKYNGSIKSGYWLFTPVVKGQKKLGFFIAKNHPFFNRKKLDHSPNTLSFNIRFLKQNASRKEEDDNWFFEADNSNFELIPVGNWLDEEPEPNNKIEVEVIFNGDVYLKGRNFYYFNNFASSGSELKFFYIRENHPRIKALLSQGKLQEAELGKRFILRYKKVDIQRNKAYNFNEFNQDLEVVEV